MPPEASNSREPRLMRSIVRRSSLPSARRCETMPNSSCSRSCGVALAQSTDDERRVGPTAVTVNRARQHLAPGAALAVEQDRAAARRDARQHVDDLPHRRRAAEDAVRRDLRRGPARSCSSSQADQVLRVGDDRARDPTARSATAARRTRPRGTLRASSPGRFGSTMPISTACGRSVRMLRAIRSASPPSRAVEQAQHRRPFAQLVQRLARAGHPARGEPERRPARRRVRA